MTNKANHADHIPLRRCVICKNKQAKESMYRIVFLNNQIIIDLKRSINSYGYYICGLDVCFDKIKKWKIKKKIKDLKV